MSFFFLQFGKPLFNSPVSMGKEVPYIWISTVHLCKSELTVTVSGREGGGRVSRQLSEAMEWLQAHLLEGSERAPLQSGYTRNYTESWCWKRSSKGIQN